MGPTSPTLLYASFLMIHGLKQPCPLAVKTFSDQRTENSLEYPALCHLIANMMHKFVSKKVLSSHVTKNIAIE